LLICFQAINQKKREGPIAVKGDTPVYSVVIVILLLLLETNYLLVTNYHHCCEFITYIM